MAAPAAALALPHLALLISPIINETNPNAQVISPDIVHPELTHKQEQKMRLFGSPVQSELMGTACPISQFKNACKLKFLLAYRDKLLKEGYDFEHMSDREEE